MKRKQQSTLNGFLGIKAQEKWELQNSILSRNHQGFEPRIRIAAFDFDNTLASNQGSHVFPKHPDDFKLFSSEIPNIFEKLHQSGFAIVVFTNQKGILDNPKRMAIFKGRIDLFLKLISVPVFVMALCLDDFNRKPRPGSWVWFHQKFNLESKPHPDSFFVGDAAGRPADHADFDRKFALNVGLDFYVPEQLILKFNESLSFETVHLPKIVQWKVADSPHQLDLCDTNVILLMGSPASGKSRFCLDYLSEYIIINQDLLKTKKKCLEALKLNLEAGKKVVIDCTNPDKSSRAVYLKAIDEKPMLIHLDTPRDLCLHNNKWRKFKTEIKTSDPAMHVPEVAIFSYWKKLELASIEEGFSRIHRLDFYPKFQSEDEKWLWELHL